MIDPTVSRPASPLIEGLLDAVPLVVAALDVECRYVYANTRYASRFGCTPSDLVGRPMADVVGAETVRLVRPYIDRALGGESLTFEMPIDYPALGRQIMRAHLSPVRDASGRVQGLYASGADVSADRVLEASLADALREKDASLRRFEELADTLPQIVWSLDGDGVHNYFNRRWYDLMGVDKGADVSAWEPLHPADRERCAREWGRSLASGQPYEQEFRLKFPGQPEYRWYLGRTVPVRDSRGEVVSWYGTSTDIHQQKLTEQELVTSRARLRAALDASDTGTFTWDLTTGALESDASLRRLLGLGADEPLAALEDMLQLVHPADRDRVAAACARTAREAGDFEEEFRIVRPGGTVRWLFNKGRVYLADDRACMTGACTDVTERREAEEALRAADRQKDEFLGIVSHELRNPLAPLVMALSMLEGEDDQQSRTRLIEVLSRQVDRIRGVVEELLDLSRVRLGKIDLQQMPLDLRTVVESAAEASRSAFAARRQQLDVQVPARPVVVRGDSRRLGQVVDNLLGNAGKFTPHTGSVWVRIDCEGGEAILSVRDTGAGIAPTMLSQVFELFAQDGDRRRSSEEGLGIGLALVDRLVRMHGGTVAAESDGQDQGSTFTVRLPLLREAPTS